MSAAIFVQSVKYALLRMARGYLALLILFVLPLALISIIGLISAHLSEVVANGFGGMDYVAISFVFAFQLFGGAYTMDYIKEDLLSARRWRIHSLPYHGSMHAGGLITAATLFSILQGAALIALTALVHGVRWGNVGWVLLVLFVVALQAQLVHLILLLAARNATVAERLAEVYGFGSFVLAGFIVPLPDNALFEFLGSYGNPISLAQNAVIGRILGDSSAHLLGRGGSQLYLSFGILVGVCIVVAATAVVVGRRKLA